MWVQSAAALTTSTSMSAAKLIFVAHPDGNNDGLYTIFGWTDLPRADAELHVFGTASSVAARLGGPNSRTPQLALPQPLSVGVGLTAGGGMDYDLPFFEQPLSLRLFEADYRLDSRQLRSLHRSSQLAELGWTREPERCESEHGYRGSLRPHHSSSAGYLCLRQSRRRRFIPGDPITVTGTAANLNPKKTATYTWTADGGTISGTSSTATSTRSRCSRHLHGEGSRIRGCTSPAEMADCSATFTVKAFEPPTISCSANPSTVNLAIRRRLPQTV
jgi:hypothetical protein